MSADDGNTLYVVSQTGIMWLSGTGAREPSVLVYASNLLQGLVYTINGAPQLFVMSATIVYSVSPSLPTSSTGFVATSVVVGTSLEGFALANATTIWLLDGITISKRVQTAGVWSVATGYPLTLPAGATTGDRAIIGRVEAGGPTWIAYISSATNVLRYDESQATGTAFSACTACWTWCVPRPGAGGVWGGWAARSA